MQYSTHYSWQILIKLEFSRHIFKKISYIKVHMNPFSGSRVIPFGWTEMMKAIVAFSNFVNVPKNWTAYCSCLLYVLRCCQRGMGQDYSASNGGREFSCIKEKGRWNGCINNNLYIHDMNDIHARVWRYALHCTEYDSLIHKAKSSSPQHIKINQ